MLVGHLQLGTLRLSVDHILSAEPRNVAFSASTTSGFSVLVKASVGNQGVTQARQEHVAYLTLGDMPGVPYFVHFGVAQGCDLLVRQFISGVPLQRVPRDMLTDDIRLSIGLHLLDTLQRVHMGGIIHRDIKPANIVIDDELQPYLIDFGVSVGRGASGKHDVLGTPMYSCR